jgi:hypothetical protein
MVTTEAPQAMLNLPQRKPSCQPLLGPWLGKGAKATKGRRISDANEFSIARCTGGWEEWPRMAYSSCRNKNSAELGWRTVDCKVSDVGVGLMGQSSRLCLAQQQTIQFSTLLVSLMAVLPNKATTTTHTGLHSWMSSWKREVNGITHFLWSLCIKNYPINATMHRFFRFLCTSGLHSRPQETSLSRVLLDHVWSLSMFRPFVTTIPLRCWTDVRFTLFFLQGLFCPGQSSGDPKVPNHVQSSDVQSHFRTVHYYYSFSLAGNTAQFGFK